MWVMHMTAKTKNIQTRLQQEADLDYLRLSYPYKKDFFRRVYVRDLNPRKNLS